MAIKREVQSVFDTNQSAPQITEKISKPGHKMMNMKSGFDKPQYTNDSLKHTAKKRRISWIVIAILCYFFFPAAVVLMLVKLHRETDRFVPNSKIIIVLGWIFCGLGIVYCLAALTGNVDSTDVGSIVFGIIVMLAICCGCGYALIRHGTKYKILGLLQQQYLPVIAASQDGSINQISKVLGKSYEDTCADIQKLIDKSLLPDSYLDITNGCLNSPLIGTQNSNRNIQQENRRTSNICCPHCGGINNVDKNGDNICDFCGSYLER